MPNSLQSGLQSGILYERSNQTTPGPRFLQPSHMSFGRQSVQDFSLVFSGVHYEINN